ncbi:MAG: transport permease protein [Actinomycetota bacterium]|nr:MAG: transport permease protein [Actinomycetota bacterium]
MSDLRLLARQVRFTNRAFWRNPASAFFTFAFPLLFLVIFTTLLGGGQTRRGGIAYDNDTYYVVSMAAFGLIQACYTNIAMSVVFAREEGVLKRLRATPFPVWAYLGARVVHAVLVAFALVAITVGFGEVVYGVGLPGGADLFRFLTTLVVGASCFTAIGLAVSGFVPNAEAAPPIVNVVMLPLLFLGLFIPIGDDAPAWIARLADVFPVKHFFDAAFTSFLGAPGFEWLDVSILGLWLAGALVVGVRRFRWEPSR